MKSKVYFVRYSESEGPERAIHKLGRLIGESRILNLIKPDFKVAVKMHFGEDGNTGYVKPEYLRLICQEIINRGAVPFISDTNTLYRGRRTNSSDHMAIASEHGFTREATGAEIVIPEDKEKGNVVDIPINSNFIKNAKLSRIFIEADFLVGVSHFKGHIMTGFGGALKNIGMGCASRVGKLQQHSDVSPVVCVAKCIGCGECVKACPVDAIALENGKALINGLNCIGCATCIAVCPKAAIEVSWESGGSTIQDKMIEYASAVLKNKKESSVFINFAIKITKECDCLAKDDPKIAPDIGILASTDPVSVDKASLDLINDVCGKDIFKEIHPQRDGGRQLEYACELGLGGLAYDLIEI